MRWFPPFARSRRPQAAPPLPPRRKRRPRPRLEVLEDRTVLSGNPYTAPAPPPVDAASLQKVVQSVPFVANIQSTLDSIIHSVTSLVPDVSSKKLLPSFTLPSGQALGNFPFFGDRLRGIADNITGFVDGVKKQLDDVGNEITQLKNEANTATDDGIKALQDQIGKGLTDAGIYITGASAAKDLPSGTDPSSWVHVAIPISKHFDLSKNIDFGLGDFLKLTVQGDPVLSVDAYYKVEFDYDTDPNFLGNRIAQPLTTLLPTKAHPLELHAFAGLSSDANHPTAVTGQISNLLYVQGADNIGSPDPNYGNLTGTAAQLTVGVGIDGFTVSGDAEIDLKLNAGFGAPPPPGTTPPDLPFDLGIHTGFKTGWHYSSADAGTAGPNTGGITGQAFGPNDLGGAADSAAGALSDAKDAVVGAVSSFDFYDVGIRAGSLLGGAVGKIIGQIQSVTKPLEPLISILTKDIPGLSDLGIHYSLSKLLGGEFDSVAHAIDTINNLPTPQDPGAGNTDPLQALLDPPDVISLGDLKLLADGASSSVGGLFDKLNSLDADPTRILAGLPSIGLPSISELGDKIAGYADTALQKIGQLPELQDIQNKLTTSSSSSATGHFSFDLPVLKNPTGVVLSLLLGKPADLFHLHADAIVGFQTNFEISSGLYSIGLLGKLNLGLHLDVGYDTHGLKLLAADFQAAFGKNQYVAADTVVKDLLAGFYLGAGTGLSLSGELGLQLGVTVAFLNGGLRAEIKFELNGDDSSGKVYFTDLGHMDFNGFLSHFKESGGIFFDASFSITIPPIGLTLYSVNIATIPIVTFSDPGANADALPNDVLFLDPAKFTADTPVLVHPYYNRRFAGTFDPDNTKYDLHGDQAISFLRGSPYTESGIEVEYSPDDIEYYPEVITVNYGPGKYYNLAVAAYSVITEKMVYLPGQPALMNDPGPRFVDDLPQHKFTVLVDDPFAVFANKPPMQFHDRNPTDANFGFTLEDGISTNYGPDGIYPAWEQKPHLVVLAGGPGDDDLEYHDDGAPNDPNRKPLGSALLVGGGGNNRLVGGIREYGNYFLPDPGTTPPTAPVGYDQSDADLNNVLRSAFHTDQLDGFTQSYLAAVVKAPYSEPVDVGALVHGQQDGNDTLIGTSGDDVLVGGTKTNTFDGVDGHDVLWGRGNVSNVYNVRFGDAVSPQVEIHAGNLRDEVVLTHASAYNVASDYPFTLAGLYTPTDQPQQLTLGPGAEDDGESFINAPPPNGDPTTGVNTGGNPAQGNLSGDPNAPPPPPPPPPKDVQITGTNGLSVKAFGVPTIRVEEDEGSLDTVNVDVQAIALAKTRLRHVELALAHGDQASKAHANTLTFEGGPGDDTFTLDGRGDLKISQPSAALFAPDIQITGLGRNPADTVVLDGRGGTNRYSVAVDAFRADILNTGSTSTNGTLAVSFVGPSDPSFLSHVTIDNQDIQDTFGSPDGFVGDVHYDASQFPTLTVTGPLEGKASYTLNRLVFAGGNTTLELGHGPSTVTVNLADRTTTITTADGAQAGDTTLYLDRTFGTFNFDNKGGSAHVFLGHDGYGLPFVQGKVSLAAGALDLDVDDSASSKPKTLDVSAGGISGLLDSGPSNFFGVPGSLTYSGTLLHLNLTASAGSAVTFDRGQFLVTTVNVSGGRVILNSLDPARQMLVNGTGPVSGGTLLYVPTPTDVHGFLLVGGNTSLLATGLQGQPVLPASRTVNFTVGGSPDYPSYTHAIYGLVASDQPIAYQPGVFIALVGPHAPLLQNVTYVLDDVAASELDLSAGNGTVQAHAIRCKTQISGGTIQVPNPDLVRAPLYVFGDGPSNFTDVQVGVPDHVTIDDVLLAARIGKLQPIAGRDVTVSADTQVSGVAVDVHARVPDPSWLGGLAPVQPIHVADSAHLTILDTADLPNTFTVDATPTAGLIVSTVRGDVAVLGTTASATIETGNRVTVGNGTIQGMKGGVLATGVTTADGAYHSPAVIVDDSADSADRAVTIAPNVLPFRTDVTGLTPAPIQVQAVGSLRVLGGTGANHITVAGNGPQVTTLFPGAQGTVDVTATTGYLSIWGGKAVNLGLGSLAAIQGTVDLFGLPGQQQTALRINDFGDRTTHQVLIGTVPLIDSHSARFPAPIGIFGLTGSGIRFDPGFVSTVSILAGGGDDTYTLIDALHVTDPLSPTGYIGAPGPYLAGLILSIVSHAGKKTLVGPDLDNTWDVTGYRQGTLNDTIQFSGMTTLRGGSGKDVFRFHSQTAVGPNSIPSAGYLDNLNGGAGTNALDFTGMDFPAHVSLLGENPADGVFGTDASLVFPRFDPLLPNNMAVPLTGVFRNITAFVGNAGARLDTGPDGYGKPPFFDDTLPHNGATNFTRTVTASAFDQADLHFYGDYAGSFVAPTVPVGSVVIDGAMTAGSALKVSTLGLLTTAGDLAGSVKGFGDASPVVGTVMVGGDLSGSITAKTIGVVQVAHDLSGTISETSPTDDMRELDVGGSITPTGAVRAAEIGRLIVAGDLAGLVDVTGALGSGVIGGELTGTLRAGSIGSLLIGVNLSAPGPAAFPLGESSAGLNGSGPALATTLFGPRLEGQPIEPGGPVGVSVTGPTAVAAANNRQAITGPASGGGDAPPDDSNLFWELWPGAQPREGVEEMLAVLPPGAEEAARGPGELPPLTDLEALATCRAPLGPCAVPAADPFDADGTAPVSSPLPARPGAALAFAVCGLALEALTGPADGTTARRALAAVPAWEGGGEAPRTLRRALNWLRRLLGQQSS